MYDLIRFFSDLMNGGIIGFTILLFIIVWSIAWIALPFYVYGVYTYAKQMNNKFQQFIEQNNISNKGSIIED